MEETTKMVVSKDTMLKEMFVDYVGNKLLSDEPEGEHEVTVEMIISVLAEEFPEFILAMAEENWIRGYQKGLDDATRLHSASDESV